jgi:hypothetical protein
MRHLLLVSLIGTFVSICAAGDVEKRALWVTGDVINDPKEGLMFRAAKPVPGNTTGNLVYLAVREDQGKVLAPIYIRAAERHLKLRLYGEFLPHSGPKTAKHPSVNFFTWKVHLATDPDELSPDQKVIFGPNQEIPGYKIIPRKP